MSGLCGWLHRAPPDGEGAERLARAASRLASNRDSEHLQVGSFRVVGVPCELLVYSNDGADLVAFGHPRFAKDDCGARDAFGFRLIEAVRAEGAAAFGALSGDFALALSDSKTGRDWLAVDRFSTRRLAYCADGLKIAFASDIDALLTLLGRRGEIDPQGIYNYVYFHVVPGPASVYRDVRFVPAGHCLLIAAEGRLTEVKYWAPGFVEDAAGSFPELKQELVDALQRATSRAAAGARCGSFLSGGIDSSTLSGMLARNRDSGVDTFSIGFNAAGYDEMMYARIATRHFGTRHHEYYVTPQDVVAAIPHIVEQYDQPFGNASAVPAFYCARLAAGHGVDRLLAGDGGDELFGGNARYARQKLFAYYEALPRSVRESFIEPALIGHVLTAKVPIVRRLRRYVEQAAVPMPDRYHLGSELVEIGPAKIFTPDFLAHVDPTEPSTLYRETFAPFAGCSLVNQMLAIDFRFTLADSDLPKVTRMCEMAGVDVVFPMLDANVVDFAAKLPPHYKLRGTKLRWFFKEALRDFLPPEIIGKKKHGFGLPAGLWLQSHEPLRVMARDALEHLGRHGIVNRSFANDAFDRLLPLHPPYYGGFIWVLMMLGLWLHSRHR